MRKSSKKYVILTVILLVLAAASVAFLNSSIGRAILKSKAHFKTSSIDSRVLYEPGVQDYAIKIARALPEAIRRVEKGHFKPFKNQLKSMSAVPRKV